MRRIGWCIAWTCLCGLLAANAGCGGPKSWYAMRVLMITGGQSHDYAALPDRLAERLNGRGSIAVHVTRDLANLNAANLSSFQVLLFNTCHQAELPETARRTILEHVRSGRGLVAMHCSLWSYQSWPQWSELLGGFAPGHDRFGTYQCTVLDPQHGAVMGLGGQFKITDEPYLIDKRDPDADVLVRTSEAIRDHAGKLRDGPEPQVWVKHYDQGRVFVTTFGHDEQSQNDEWFITLLHTGIRWAGRDVPDTPHNVLTSAERQEGYELLFDGRDLSGWAGDSGHWTVENGELVGRSQDLPHNMFLHTRKEYGDFRLKCSVRIRNHNSGVQFRSRVFPENVVKGYQADIAADRYGNLYEEGGKRKRLVDSFQEKGSTVAIPDGWNDLTINAVGPRIIITCNGLPTVDYEEKDPAAQPASGVIALQLHAGPPMEVRFRDIRIKPLNAAEWK